MAANYKVNIELDTKKLDKQLKDLGIKVDKVGKVKQGQSKKTIDNDEQEIRLKNKALGLEKKVVDLRRQGYDKSLKLRRNDEFLGNLGEAKLKIDEKKLDLATNEIKKAELLLAESKKNLAVEKDLLKTRQKTISTGVSSPVSGKPTQIGSPANIAEILNNPLSPNSPVQKALKEMDDRGKKSKKQAELNRNKSLSLGKDIVGIKTKEASLKK